MLSVEDVIAMEPQLYSKNNELNFKYPNLLTYL